MDREVHWRRSEELADSTRRYLIAVHTGGIGVSFAVASAFADNGIAPAWAWWPVSFFSVGMGLVFLSLFLAKDRELARYKAGGRNNITFPWYRGSWPWDAASAIAFVVGAIAGLIKISQMGVVS